MNRLTLHNIGQIHAAGLGPDEHGEITEGQVGALVAEQQAGNLQPGQVPVIQPPALAGAGLRG